MANAATFDNGNRLGLVASANTTVASVDLSISGATAHHVFVIGEFSVECSSCTNALVAGDIQADGNTIFATQVNNLNGPFGTLIVVSGVALMGPGSHRFDLRAYTRTANFVAHHRTLSVIDLN